MLSTPLDHVLVPLLPSAWTVYPPPFTCGLCTSLPFPFTWNYQVNNDNNEANYPLRDYFDELPSSQDEHKEKVGSQ